ncbi:MAG TPA: hypothetical protein VF467_05180 [Afipia sp.]
MARKFYIRIGVAGAWAVMLAPSVCSANQLNLHPTITPVRPQIHLSPSLHTDARSRALDNIDLSDACRADERIKPKGKREWRCRQDR